MDIADAASVSALVKRAVDHFGRLDAAFNNASTASYVSLEQGTAEEFDRVSIVADGGFNIAGAR